MRQQSTRPGQWLLMNWELPAGRSVSPEAIVSQIRKGAELRRYWLRAYVVWGRRVSLLFYPTVGLDAVERELRMSLGVPASLRVRTITDDLALERSATYLEHLPIRNGAVTRPEDYNWSSAGWVTATAAGL